MLIRKAQKEDISGLMSLLRQVLTVHADKRPDIFKPGTTKYTEEELFYIITNPLTPVFVAVDENGNVLGHSFCKFIQFSNNNSLTDMRGQHIGKALYEYTIDFARQENCYNVTLNVWATNDSAMKFYESMGLSVQKIGMEKIL